ncbi:MAG: hypothetical protein E7K04_02885 [Helicobacter sp.]|nr:hypothetical protein [Helicobacter sp.]
MNRRDGGDVDILIKNLIFFIIFCFLIILALNFYILDAIKKYKTNYFNNKNQTIALNVVKDQLNGLQGDFTLLLNKNRSDLESIKIDPTPKDLNKILQNFFYDISISSISQSKDHDFIKSEFAIKARAKDLVSINKFFTFLKNPPINLRVSTPFLLKKQDGAFIVEFNLKNQKTIYKMQK